MNEIKSFVEQREELYQIQGARLPDLGRCMNKTPPAQLLEFSQFT